MPSQGWYQALGPGGLGDGTAVTGTTLGSLLLVSGSPSVITLEAGYFDRPGKKLIVEATGRISNIVTTPGTLTVQLFLGATAVAISRGISLNIVAKTNVGWYLKWLLTARTVGSGTIATLMHNGNWTSESVIGSAAGSGYSASLQDAPAVGAGFSSVVANAVDLQAKFSLTGNSIQCHDILITSPN
jgi:hypothetical protein